MENPLIRERRSITLMWIFLILLLTARFFLNFMLWDKAGGFFMLTGDDAAKARSAYSWAKDFNFLGQSKTSLPPVYPWIIMLGFKIYPDLLLTPSLINTLFGLGSILILFLLTRRLFPSSNLAVLVTVGFISFHPWFAWSTLGTMRDTVLRFFILMGMFFWISYIKDKRKKWLLFSAIMFFLSTATMYEGWFFTSIFIFFILGEFFIYYRDYKKINYYLLFSIFLSSIYIIWRLYWDYRRYGNPFGYLFIERSEYVYAYQTVGFLKRLISYPKHLIGMAPWVFPTVIIMMFMPKRLGRIGLNYVYFVLSGFIIFIISALIQTGYSPYTPQRALVLFLCLFLPVASFGIASLLAKFKNRVVYLFIILLFIVSSSINALASFKPPESEIRKEALQVGLLLRSIWRHHDISAKDKVILEEMADAKDNRVSIECYTLRLFNPDRIISDRKWKFAKKNRIWTCISDNNPSTFDLPEEALHTYLRKENFRIAIVHSDMVEEKISKIMTYALNIGEYKFYLFPEDRDLSDIIKFRTKHLPVPLLGR